MSDIKTSRLQISRIFTRPELGPYAGIEFTERISKLIGSNGKVKSEAKVIAPADWDQNSIDIIAHKYMRKAGVPVFLEKVPEYGIPEWLYRSKRNENEEAQFRSEDDVRATFDRLAGSWTYWGWKLGYFNSEEDAKAYFDEMRYMMINQMASANSPQYFNAGIHWAYGIDGPSNGHYYFDYETNTVVPSTSTYERPQVHACFILSIRDNLVEKNGIMDFLVREGRIFKFGSGSGANFSALRGDGESLSSGGESSGAKSFLKIFDTSAGSIKSGGKSRRAAKMVVMNIDHPDIREIINWKVTEEDKVVSLIAGSKLIKSFLNKVQQACSSWNGEEPLNIYTNKDLAEVFAEGLKNNIPIGFLSRISQLLAQGVTEFVWDEFDSSYIGEAYMTVSGQNANNSVMLTNDFMEKLIKNLDFELINRTDGKSAQVLPAKKIWDEICTSAWICADPGVMFYDTINDWNTCPDQHIHASNPCCEYIFRDDTACNLASINLCTFLNGKEFDVDKFLHACRLLTITLEISVGMGQYPSERIAELSYRFRTLGLGYANLGSLLMRLGMPYDSPKGRAYAAYLTALMHMKAYETSAEMAQCFGPFEGYFQNAEAMMKVVRNHRNLIFNEPCVDVKIQPVPLDRANLTQEQLNILDELAESTLKLGAQFGFRNAQVTAIAPTGTIGILMACKTTGCEPRYATTYIKKLASGGYMSLVDESITTALENLGYEQEQISDIMQYIIGHGNIDNAPCINRRTLKEKGFTDKDIDAINAAIPSSMNLESAFSTWVLGDDILDRLEIIPMMASNPVPSDLSMLESLGFTQSEIKEAGLYALGYKCIEGAPHLKQEHLAIFDCANKNGDFGERFISIHGHISMLAAIQSFVSGGISKTINMPSEATIQDCADVYLNAWKMSIKGISLFRDGSKLSSAMYSSRSNELLSYLQSVSTTKEESKDLLPRGAREVLPERRIGQIQKVKIGDSKYTFFYIIGRNEAGEIREIFLTGGGKEGTAFRSLLSCFAQSVSMLLQYGAPLDAIISHFEHCSFRPSGLVYGPDNVNQATSIVDCIMQCLRDELKKSAPKLEQSQKSKSNKRKYSEIPSNKNYTGESCPECGEFKMRKLGGCSTCEGCGANSGCG